MLDELQKAFMNLQFQLTIFHFGLLMLVVKDPNDRNGFNVLILSHLYYF